MGVATTPTCAVEDCGRRSDVRGWCAMHYKRQLRAGLPRIYEREWVNPLVCVCETPDADPRRDFGMCQVCKRKPLALMAVPS